MQINEKLIKPKKYDITLNTEYIYESEFSVDCFKIGNLAFVSINTIAFKTSEIPNYSILFSGLPKPKQQEIFLLYAFNGTSRNCIRVRIDESGNIVLHWSSVPNSGDAGNIQYGGILIYETTD